MKKNRFFSFIVLIALFCGLFPPASALEDPQPDCTAAILVDVTYDQILYEYNAHESRAPASITKIMTALLTLEAVERGDLSLDQEIAGTTAINDDLSLEGSTQNILAGEYMSVKNLLYCVLVASANEACNILAQAVSGDISTFIAAMNTRAQELGMTGTHFTNAHGLPDDNHYTTAYDIYLMLNEAMKHELFREIVHTEQYTVPATNLSEARTFSNTDALITQLRYVGYLYEYALGGKTGSTDEAGHCLASSAEKDGRTLICVVLGAQNITKEDGTILRQSFSESKDLFEWGFNNFSVQNLVSDGELLQEVGVTLSQEANYVMARSQGSISALLPNDYDTGSLEKKITLNADSIEAPVEEGQVLGQVSVVYNGEEYGVLPLVASNSLSRSQLLYVLHCIQEFFGQTWVKLAGLALLILIFVFVIRLLFFRRHRSRSHRSNSFPSRGSHYRGRRRR